MTRRNSLVSGSEISSQPASRSWSLIRASTRSAVSKTFAACSCIMAAVRSTVSAPSRRTSARFHPAAAANTTAGTSTEAARSR
jgi:hypothetical protein